MTVAEYMEQLVVKYPEHAESLRGCVLPEDVLEAELKEFQKREKMEE